jgi:hypothetical protein
MRDFLFNRAYQPERQSVCSTEGMKVQSLRFDLDYRIVIAGWLLLVFLSAIVFPIFVFWKGGVHWFRNETHKASPRESLPEPPPRQIS